MLMKNLVKSAACVGMLLLANGSTASAANMLANPGFEAPVATPEYFGAGGWTTFGNGFTDAANPCLVPHSGNQLMKMYGTFNPFGVSGIFQEFPTSPGEKWSLSCYSRHCSDDAMVGNHVLGGTGNWVVQKLAFFDALNNEIAPAAVESTILDGSYAVNTWFNNAPINGVAPAGCVKVQAFVLYLQPGFDGGAAQIDDVNLEKVLVTPTKATTWSKLRTIYR